MKIIAGEWLQGKSPKEKFSKVCWQYTTGEAASPIISYSKSGGHTEYTERNDRIMKSESTEAFLHLKEVMGGLKKSTGELVEEFTDLIGVAQANGGKIPDVNEILCQVLSECDKEGKK